MKAFCNKIFLSFACIVLLVLLGIMSYLKGINDAEEHRNRVDQYATLNEQFKGRHRVNIYFDQETKDQDIQAIAADLNAIPDMEEIHLSNSQITSKSLGILTSISSLQILTLSNTQVDDHGCDSLRRLRNLQTIELDGTSITGQEISKLCQSSSLADVQLDANQLKEMGPYPNLGCVRYITIINATTESASLLANKLQLTAIGFHGSGFDDESLSILNSLTELEVLGLYNTSVSDQGLSHLAAFHRLTFLTIEGAGITDESIPYICEVPNLRRLTLTGTQISKSGIKELFDDTQNLSLYVNGRIITQNTLSHYVSEND